jgi:hypothetical protein
MLSFGVSLRDAAEDVLANDNRHETLKSIAKLAMAEVDRDPKNAMRILGMVMVHSADFGADVARMMGVGLHPLGAIIGAASIPPCGTIMKGRSCVPLGD